MHIQVVSRGIDASDALKDRVTERVEAAVEKYFNRSGEAFAVVSREGSGFKADVSLHLTSGAFLQAEGADNDAYAAVEDALIHLEKRLRRYKRRLRDRRAPGHAMTTFVLQGGLNAPDDHDESDAFDAPAANDVAAQPIVIAERSGELPVLTVGGAVHELEASDAPALFFRNAAHGGLNVIYRRPDGHLGWIDPTAGATAP